ncbi:MAG: cobalamin B12-binding domain-containing protein, partial [Myxococcales bacterium]
PPLEDYSLTHGICSVCMTHAQYSSDEAVRRVRPIVAFYSDLMQMAERGVQVPVQEMIARGVALGIRPVDLLMGVIQPTLYEVGRRWDQGLMTPAQETSFSSFCDAVLVELTEQQAVNSLPEGAPRVLMMNARGNLHTLGLRMATFLLRDRGLDARALTPTPGRPELAAVLERERPAVVGVSLALAWQCTFLDEILELTRDFDPRPRIMAGGPAVRAGCVLPAGVEG